MNRRYQLSYDCAADCDCHHPTAPARLIWLVRNAGALILIALISLVFLATRQAPGISPLGPSPISGYALPVATQNPMPTPMPTATPDAPTLNGYGKAALAEGDYGRAETLFRAAIIAEPGFYEPYNNLAFVRYEQRYDDEAVGLWRKALRLYPDSPDANAGLGMALAVRGQLDEGWLSYRRALELAPGYADAAWMQRERAWGTRALRDSMPLRQMAYTR